MILQSFVSLEMLAIFINATLLIGLLNFGMNISLSRKRRHVEIASMRRRERMDNFITYYSKLSALVHPETVKAYALNKDNSFFEKIIESYSNLNMLFDHRYEKDKEFVNSIKPLINNAITCYYICGSSDTASIMLCEKEYSSEIKKTDKLLNIYIGTEWSRLNEEAKTGKRVHKKDWDKIYEKSKQDFEQWEHLDRPLLTSGLAQQWQESTTSPNHHIAN